jgi:hypothetical protein
LGTLEITPLLTYCKGYFAAMNTTSVDVSLRDGRQRLLLLAAIALLCLAVHTQSSAQTKDEQKAITVRGTLERVVGIGGETTGWAIRLDSEVEIGGKRLKSLEVSGDNAEFAKLEHKFVEATGKPSTRRGVERGEWPVLEIISIKTSEQRPLASSC